MEKNISLIYLFLYLFLVSCVQNDNQSGIYAATQIKEQATKELENITLYYDGSGDSYIVALKSNNLISMIEESYDDIDTIEFTSKDSCLFLDMQMLLKTAIIDSTMYIGRADTILRYEEVKNIAGVGFVIKHTNIQTIDTILAGSSEYQRLKHGKYECVKLGMTVLCPYELDRNDISADHMLIYRNKDRSIANDILCYNRSSNIVRINSYVAVVDSILFRAITDTLNKIILEKK